MIQSSAREKTIRVSILNRNSQGFLYYRNPCEFVKCHVEYLYSLHVHWFTFSEPLQSPNYRKSSGTIDVIGGTTRDSRRPQEAFQEDLASAEAQD